MQWIGFVSSRYRISCRMMRSFLCAWFVSWRTEYHSITYALNMEEVRSFCSCFRCDLSTNERPQSLHLFFAFPALFRPSFFTLEDPHSGHFFWHNYSIWKNSTADGTILAFVVKRIQEIQPTFFSIYPFPGKIWFACLRNSPQNNRPYSVYTIIPA